MKPTTKINKIAEAIKSVFEAIGYFAYFRPDHNSVWIYEKDTPQGLEFIGAATPVINDMKISYRYNDDEFTNILMMINAMNQDNSKLFFPAYTQDPMMHPLARTKKKIDWYMCKVLGFSRPGWEEYPICCDEEVYVLRNIYNEIVSKIYIHYNESYDDQTADITGSVYRVINKSYAIIIYDFKNIDECIACINGLIEPEYVTDIVSKLQVTENMTDDRNYNGTALVVDKYFNVHKKNIKNATKKLLQEALARMEAE